MKQSARVAIVGGGAAGAATALALRRQLPSCKVQLFAAPDAGAPRIGETLHPRAQPLLEQLGVWQAFLDAPHVEDVGTTSAWGGDDLTGDDYITTVFGRGFHLDRPAFDRMLVERAVAHGAELIDAIWLSISSLGSQFRLEVDRRPPLEADFVIDATGRRGRVAQAMGARRVLFDRQVTAVLFFDTAPNFRSDRTWIEAAEHGWWYAARIPRGAVAAFSTDSDIARQLKLRDGTALSRQLNSTRQLRNLLRDAHPTHAPRLVPSSSSMLDDFAGEGWAAVGDAAISSDPLSGQGLLNALRHAFLATHLVSDYLGGKQDVHRVYQTHLLQQAEDYFAARAEVYATEHRFDDSPFWRRRRSQITLAPDRPVSMGDPVAARQVRWLLPAKDMARLATCAVGGGTASEVIASARASGVQASDRRLVLALQHLVAAKIVR